MIGLIGAGVVGGALLSACEKRGLEVATYDKFKNVGSFGNVLSAKVLFICVPTPTTKYMQDLSAVDETFSKLEAKDFSGAVVLKSTILPGTCDQLVARHPGIRLVHNPEFLTEARANQDFLDQPAVLISSPDQDAFSATCDVYSGIEPTTSELTARR